MWPKIPKTAKHCYTLAWALASLRSWSKGNLVADGRTWRKFTISQNTPQPTLCDNKCSPGPELVALVVPGILQAWDWHDIRDYQKNSFVSIKPLEEVDDERKISGERSRRSVSCWNSQKEKDHQDQHHLFGLQNLLKLFLNVSKGPPVSNGGTSEESLNWVQNFPWIV